MPTPPQVGSPPTAAPAAGTAASAPVQYRIKSTGQVITHAPPPLPAEPETMYTRRKNRVRPQFIPAEFLDSESDDDVSESDEDSSDDSSYESESSFDGTASTSSCPDIEDWLTGPPLTAMEKLSNEFPNPERDELIREIIQKSKVDNLSSRKKIATRQNAIEVAAECEEDQKEIEESLAKIFTHLEKAQKRREEAKAQKKANHEWDESRTLEALVVDLCEVKMEEYRVFRKEIKETLMHVVDLSRDSRRTCCQVSGTVVAQRSRPVSTCSISFNGVVRFE